MRNQRGFTIHEVLLLLLALVCLALVAGAVYAAVHFITKYW